MSSDKQQQSSGLSLRTLAISSASAVAAAVIVPLFWERGSLIATAVTPIIVALVSEFLQRPAQVITAAKPRATRRGATAAAARAKQPTGVGSRSERPEQPWGPEDDPFGLRTPARRPRRAWWKIAVATGLLAFVIGAVVVTVSELAIFGHSVTGRDRATSVFGGRESPSRDEREEETPAATPEASPTEDAEQQATPAPTVTTQPSPTVSAVPSPLSGEPTPAPTVAAPTPTP